MLELLLAFYSLEVVKISKEKTFDDPYKKFTVPVRLFTVQQLRDWANPSNDYVQTNFTQ